MRSSRLAASTDFGGLLHADYCVCPRDGNARDMEGRNMTMETVINEKTKRTRWRK